MLAKWHFFKWKQLEMLKKIYNAQLCVLPREIREFAVCSISDWKDTYLPECVECDLRTQCGGLFAANQKYHSNYIAPQKNEDVASSFS